MWLTSSSIGRKFVMAITGACLVLFVTFHCLMNSVAIFWPAAYNMVCEFLGANWYALVASAGLALLFIIHIIYAIWLTIQNRNARGADRYEVNGAVPQVEWSSKNMFVLGIVVLAFLVVHLIQFWAKMQLVELTHHELAGLPQVDGFVAEPQFGTLLIQQAFSQIWTPIVYIIGFVALWFHMNHGFWSMFQTVGWNNNVWMQRIKCISCWWTSVVVVLFIAQAVVFTVQANNKYYTTNAKLQEQYIDSLNDQCLEVLQEMQENENFARAAQMLQYAGPAMLQQYAQTEEGKAYFNRLKPFLGLGEKSNILGYANAIYQAAYPAPAEVPAMEEEAAPVEIDEASVLMVEEDANTENN